MLRSHRPRLVFSSALASLGLLWALASGVTCATGGAPIGTGGATASTTSTTSASTSSTGGGATGGGGASTTTTSSSTTTSTTTSSSSSSGTGGATTTSTTSSTSSSGLGGPPNIVQLYATGNLLVGQSYNVPSMMGSLSNPFGEDTQDAIGLAFTGQGVAVAVMRSQGLPDAGPLGELHWARWNGSFTPGFGGVWPAVMPGLLINGGPSIAGSALKAHCAYQGTDMNYYYAEFFNNAWTTTNQPITAGGTPSTGPQPPAIVALANNPIIAYIGNDQDLHDQALVAGVWQPQHAHGATGAASTTPAIVAPAQGPELLVVFASAAAQNLMFTARTAGTWTTPALIPGASSGDQVSLAPLAAGGAILVWRGTDMLLYTSMFSAGPPASWSVPVTGVMGSNPTLVTPPAVATGASGAQAELLYLDTNLYELYSARMIAGAWGPRIGAGSATFRMAVATGN
jgi:hypothetical protein